MDSVDERPLAVRRKRRSSMAPSEVVAQGTTVHKSNEEPVAEAAPTSSQKPQANATSVFVSRIDWSGLSPIPRLA